MGTDDLKLGHAKQTWHTKTAFFALRVLLSRGGDPAGVGVEEEEEDHAEGHEIHIDEK